MKKLLIQKISPYLPASSKTLAINFVYTSMFRALTIGMGFLTTYFLARSVSKEELGAYYFILNIVSVCWIFALPGMQNAIMQNTSRLDGSVYRKASDLTFLCSVLGSLVLLAFANFYHLSGQEEMKTAFSAAAAAFPFYKGLQHWRGVKMGRENFRDLSLNEGITTVLTSCCMVAAIHIFPGSILAPLAVLLMVPSLQNIIMSLYERARTAGDKEEHEEYVRYGFKTSYHLAVGILSQHLDKILIYAFLSPASLAIYVAGSRFSEIARDAMQDLAVVITPRLAKASVYSDRLHNIFRFTAIIYGCSLTIFAFTLLPWLIVFIFGEKFEDAIPYAQALMISNAIGTLPSLQFRYIRSQLDEKSHKETSLYVAVAQIVLSSVLIPVFGLPGAVAVAYCNRIILTICVRRILKQRKDIKV